MELDCAEQSVSVFQIPCATKQGDTMTWQPITEEKLLELMEEEIFYMSEEARQKFESIKIPLTRVKCRRKLLNGVDYCEDPIFIVGRSGNKLLVYDDEEEEFAIAEPEPGATFLEHLELCGELEMALKHL
jgi:hypothetical protein